MLLGILRSNQPRGVGKSSGNNRGACLPPTSSCLAVAVDPCDRFVYVSDSLTNRISAYTICSQITGTCPNADGALVQVAGSPFPLSGSANGPGPIVVDPFGNNVYVVGTLSNTLSLFKISTVSGGLTAMNPATVVTGSRPTSITIRADDNWMFVSNYNSGSVSQYSITPATGDACGCGSDYDRQSALWSGSEVGQW